MYRYILYFFLVLCMPCHANLKNIPIVSSEQLDRLVIFARIATDVRYFHPSDGVSATNWDAFLAAGMYEVLQNESQFDETLRRLFKDLAPTMQINNIPCAKTENEISERVMVWQQDGYVEEQDYNSRGSNYQRKRVCLLVSEATEFIQPYRANYGAVRLELPLFQYVDVHNATMPKSDGYTNSCYQGLDTLQSKYVRLATVTKIWGVIQNFYPYMNDIDVCWEKELNNLLLSCETTPLAMFKTVRQALTKLQDNHIGLTSQDIPFYTIPVGFDWVENKAIVIYKASDALAIEVGDELLQVDDIDVCELISELEPLSLTSPHQAKSTVCLNYLIRRQENAPVSLTLKNSQGMTYIIHASATSHFGDIVSKATNSYCFYNSPLIREVEPAIFHINLSQMQMKDLGHVLEQIIHARALILDLRTYPVDFEAWQAFLVHFSERPLLGMSFFQYMPIQPNRMVIKEFHEWAETLPPAKVQLKMPAVALCSKFSISQNEHALGFVQAAKIPICGEITAGINGEITCMHLLDGTKEGFLISFTGMKVAQRDNSKHIGVGIIPDHLVPRTQNGIRGGIDEQLQAALHLLTQSSKLI